MIWQDLVIAIANIIFSLALIPQVFYGFKKKKGLVTIATSAPTSVGLYAVTVAFFTLSLYFSAIVLFINGTFWLILLMQKIIYKKV